MRSKNLLPPRMESAFLFLFFLLFLVQNIVVKKEGFIYDGMRGLGLGLGFLFLFFLNVFFGSLGCLLVFGLLRLGYPIFILENIYTYSPVHTYVIPGSFYPPDPLGGR